ncbi:putative nucleotidyltransferase [Paenibacillus endophyticus]|uniref:tRNA(Met) cytidine acetate ligase n=1 Tax=Paenibacillus endophyticus TaxID=1294268 RepID=A0A7W5C730_9BACL|nr:nucleotidyltransferase [Paenibacillus endophyticus]MBB3152152.1 putative nucleotidyltransferase [Paenibacillus endophyticus]
MRTVGLIVEYNPFHNGHLYHLQQSRKITQADAVVAVMSGHFLQRGEPALLDKWSRTQMALEGGCDLVIELPVAYATQAAEWFAYGAVSLLEATGVVDSFCFGTENGELDPLLKAADIVAEEPPAFKALLKQQLQTGVSYPSAYSSAITSYLAELGHATASAFPFALPNHTLGLHYLLARNRLQAKMEPFTIAREKAQYNQATATDSQIASATAIRKLLLEQQSLEDVRAYVPESTWNILQQEWSAGRCPISWEPFTNALLQAIITRTPQDLADLHEITEGLEYRIRGVLPTLPSRSFDDLLSALKTKRYTRTKLQRSLLAILLGHRKQDFTADKLASGVEYIRVLGFSEKGKLLLRRMRNSAKLPVLHSAARAPQPYRYLELDTQASGVYMLGVSGQTSVASMFRDFTEKPVTAGSNFI